MSDKPSKLKIADREFASRLLVGTGKFSSNESMRDALQSRDRQLKMMLGGVAHEVKNPLGGIELFAGLLHEELTSVTPNSADAIEHTARIQHQLA